MTYEAADWKYLLASLLSPKDLSSLKQHMTATGTVISDRPTSSTILQSGACMACMILRLQQVLMDSALGFTVTDRTEQEWRHLYESSQTTGLFILTLQGPTRERIAYSICTEIAERALTLH